MLKVWQVFFGRGRGIFCLSSLRYLRAFLLLLCSVVRSNEIDWARPGIDEGNIVFFLLRIVAWFSYFDTNLKTKYNVCKIKISNSNCTEWSFSNSGETLRRKPLKCTQLAWEWRRCAITGIQSIQKVGIGCLLLDTCVIARQSLDK